MKQNQEHRRLNLVIISATLGKRPMFNTWSVFGSQDLFGVLPPFFGTSWSAPSHLALRRLLALSSQCSDMVSCSWRRAMAFSTDEWGARPTPWSMSILMVSRVRVAGWVAACCTASSHRACSSLTLSLGSSGRSTSKSKLTSNRLWISATLGDSSAKTFSLCCWKSSMRFKSS